MTVKDGKVEGDDLPVSICLLRNADDDFSEDERLANGFQIAAAPELYGALDNAPLPSTLGNREDHYQRFYRWFNDVAQPALAKARGEVA